MKSCTDCIHFKSCEDWAKHCKLKEFPFETKDESIKLCDFYEDIKEHDLAVIRNFAKILKSRFECEPRHLSLTKKICGDVRSAIDTLVKECEKAGGKGGND
ncbi:MAG: hypothetical protein UGF89_06605 [Acutalibacteraceae bacterium]|nr:hypothetical protein [Acutalibacteraceae bacterium]